MKFKTLLKLGFVVVLFYYLSKRGFLSFEATKNALFQWQYTLPAFGVLIFSTFVGIVRWQILLHAQSIYLPWTRVLQLGLIGNFFNIALPGAVSGDVVKAIYVAREVQGMRARAFSSILFDRVSGVSALVLVSATALLYSFKSQWGNQLLPSIEVFVVSCGVGVVLFYGYLFVVKENHDPLLRLFNRLALRFKVMGSFARIYEGLRHYHARKTVVVQSLVISIFIHCLVIFACVCFAKAFGEFGLSTVAQAVVIPLGLLVTAIPVMPAGVGTGHAAFLWLYHLLGSQRGADVFSLFVLYQIFQGLAGGLVYLKFKSSGQLADTNADTNLAVP